MNNSEFLSGIEKEASRLSDRSYVRFLELTAILPMPFKKWRSKSLKYFIEILHKPDDHDSIILKKEICELFYSSFMYWKPFEIEYFIKDLEKVSSKNSEIQFFLDSMFCTLNIIKSRQIKKNICELLETLEDADEKISKALNSKELPEDLLKLLSEYVTEDISVSKNEASWELTSGRKVFLIKKNEKKLMLYKKTNKTEKFTKAEELEQIINKFNQNTDRWQRYFNNYLDMQTNEWIVSLPNPYIYYDELASHIFESMQKEKLKNKTSKIQKVLKDAIAKLSLCWEEERFLSIKISKVNLIGLICLFSNDSKSILGNEENSALQKNLYQICREKR